jgi:hypothetical protein
MNVQGHTSDHDTVIDVPPPSSSPPPPDEDSIAIDADVEATVDQDKEDTDDNEIRAELQSLHEMSALDRGVSVSPSPCASLDSPSSSASEAATNGVNKGHPRVFRQAW